MTAPLAKEQFPAVVANPGVVYLDSAATAAKPQRVVDAVTAQLVGQGHGKVAFMQPEAVLACAVGRGGGDGWPLLCCPGRPGAGG